MSSASKEERRRRWQSDIAVVKSRREALMQRAATLDPSMDVDDADPEVAAARVEDNDADVRTDGVAGEAVASEASSSARRLRLAEMRSAADASRKLRQDSVEVLQDARGDDMLVLRAGVAAGCGANRVVMMAWERDYMEACVVKLAPTPQDRVLEVGFGLGFSATAIAAGEPKRHTILECAPAVLRRAHAWAASRGNTDIVAETWQSYLAPREGAAAFDAVFFDDFPLQAQPRGESRWHTFLRAVEPRLAENARLTGYFANDGALADLPTGFAVESRAKFDVEPSEDCPYFSKEDEALLVILRYSRHPSSS